MTIFEDASGFGPEIKCESQNCSRHWVFALDTSGSMNGTATDLAKEAGKEIIDTLSDNDYVGVIEYESSAYSVHSN